MTKPVKGNPDGLPINQMFTDEYVELVNKYCGEGINNAEVIGSSVMVLFELLTNIQESTIKEENE